MVTITGNLNTLLGLRPSRSFTSGDVKVTLVLPVNFTGNPNRTDGTPMRPLILDQDVSSDGSFSALVDGNDAIFPFGTLYKLELAVPNISSRYLLYSIVGSGPVDLSSLPFMSYQDATANFDQVSARITEGF